MNPIKPNPFKTLWKPGATEIETNGIGTDENIQLTAEFSEFCENFRPFKSFLPSSNFIFDQRPSNNFFMKNKMIRVEMNIWWDWPFLIVRMEYSFRILSYPTT